jgi:hypothetical protein
MVHVVVVVQAAVVGIVTVIAAGAPGATMFTATSDDIGLVTSPGTSARRA